MEEESIIEARLNRLKDSYLARIRERESEIANVKQKLAVVEQVLADCQHLGNLAPVAPTENRFSGAERGLTDALLVAMESIQHPARPPEIRDFLLANGFQPKAKRFLSHVSTTLRRLEQGGRITKEPTPKGTAYKRKER